MAFPKMVYNSAGRGTIVASQEAQDALVGTWAESPAYFGYVTAPSVAQRARGVPATPACAPLTSVTIAVKAVTDPVPSETTVQTHAVGTRPVKTTGKRR